jgi:hypothetical protein
LWHTTIFHWHAAVHWHTTVLHHQSIMNDHIFCKIDFF